MSDYLIGRIEASPEITLHTETEITALAGERHLEEVTWRDRRTGDESDAADRQRVPHDRRRAEHRVAARLRGRSTTRASSAAAPNGSAPRAGAGSPRLLRDQPPRRVRGRRRAGGLGQARRLGRRRGLDRGLVRAPGPGRGLTARGSAQAGAVVPRAPVEVRHDRHDAGRIDAAMALVIVPPDVLQVDGIAETRRLMKVAGVGP